MLWPVLMPPNVLSCLLGPSTSDLFLYTLGCCGDRDSPSPYSWHPRSLTWCGAWGKKTKEHFSEIFQVSFFSFSSSSFSSLPFRLDWFSDNPGWLQTQYVAGRNLAIISPYAMLGLQYVPPHLIPGPPARQATERLGYTLGAPLLLLRIIVWIPVLIAFLDTHPLQWGAGSPSRREKPTGYQLAWSPCWHTWKPMSKGERQCSRGRAGVALFTSGVRKNGFRRFDNLVQVIQLACHRVISLQRVF